MQRAYQYRPAETAGQMVNRFIEWTSKPFESALAEIVSAAACGTVFFLVLLLVYMLTA